MMEESSLDSLLLKLFSRSSREDWSAIASQEAGSEDPLTKLQWQNRDRLPFLPYYDAANDNELQFIRKFAQSSGNGMDWLNLPLVNVENPEVANERALDHLMNGADGVVCDLRTVAQPDLNTLTNNIEWRYCYLAFWLHKDASCLRQLTEIIKDRSLPPEIKGGLFWETVPKSSELSFHTGYGADFNVLGFLIPESSPAEEVSEALFRGVTAIDAFGGGALQENVFRSVAFNIPADATLIETTAKFKALRILWFQVAKAYGIQRYRPDDVFIAARSTFASDKDFGPHENMLKATFAAIGAVMGGCNALTIETDNSTPLLARCARNVSTILKEESLFDKASDPIAGAWAFEAVTDGIARKAWELFQQKCSTHAAT